MTVHIGKNLQHDLESASVKVPFISMAGSGTEKIEVVGPIRDRSFIWETDGVGYNGLMTHHTSSISVTDSVDLAVFILSRSKFTPQQIILKLQQQGVNILAET